MVTNYKHFQLTKYYWGLVLPFLWLWAFHWDLVGGLSREYVICLCSVKICILKTVYAEEYGKQPSTFINSKTTNKNNHTNALTTKKWILLTLDKLCLQSLNFLDPWLRFWFDIHLILEWYCLLVLYGCPFYVLVLHLIWSTIIAILCLRSLNFLDPWLRFWFDIHPVVEYCWLVL